MGPDGLEIALKILRVRSPQSEAYRRFRDEIQIQTSLSNVSGVLPLIDSNLPQHPSRDNLPWLAMPIARMARDALHEVDIQTVLEAIASIAETLAHLHGQGISHRDVKPENLYLYEQRWVIGDFGLVEFPDKEALTIEGKKLGPAHFLAPEMVLSPESSEGPPADVYSLAKSLWVLATGQQWPPPGEHRLDRAEMLVSTYVGGQRTALLDPIIERATLYKPEKRYTASEFAHQLRLWLTPTEEVSANASDLTIVAERIRGFDAHEMAKEQALADLLPKMNNAIRRLKDVLDRFNADLHALIPRRGYYVSSTLISDLKILPPVTYFHGFCSHRLADTERKNLGALQFYAAIGGGLLQDERAAVGAAYVIMDNRRKEVPWQSSESFEIGTAEENHAITSLANGLNAHLQIAVERFLQILEERGDEQGET